MVEGLHCALCHKAQVRVYYDGAGRPVGLCCIRHACEDANLVLLSFDDLMARLIGRK